MTHQCKRCQQAFVQCVCTTHATTPQTPKGK
jgi:hypothetical protein